jgi:hypothetical protein
MSALNIALTARKTPDELIIQARVLFNDCSHMSAEDFRESVKRCRQSSPYFPTPHDVMSKYRLIKSESAAKEAAQLPMPENIPEEQLEINRKGIESVKKRLARKFDMNR